MAGAPTPGSGAARPFFVVKRVVQRLEGHSLRPRAGLLAPGLQGGGEVLLYLATFLLYLRILVGQGLVDDPAHIIIETEVVQYVSGILVILPFKTCLLYTSPTPRD